MTIQERTTFDLICAIHATDNRSKNDIKISVKKEIRVTNLPSESVEEMVYTVRSDSNVKTIVGDTTIGEYAIVRRYEVDSAGLIMSQYYDGEPRKVSFINVTEAIIHGYLYFI